MRHWRDIWLHEGFACYSEWLWSERSGGRSAQPHAEQHWQRLADLPQDLVLTDPSRERMFDDRVHKRGALTLHAIRLHPGDAPFFAMLRAWVSNNLQGSLTTGDFVAHVAAAGGGPGSRMISEWLFESRLPPLPARTGG